MFTPLHIRNKKFQELSSQDEIWTLEMAENKYFFRIVFFFWMNEKLFLYVTKAENESLGKERKKGQNNRIVW